jgi:ADP-heptose:LPS heptosyltransferase
VGQSREPLSGVRRIAVLRANGLGDLIFALPALEALRRAYPSSEIALLATDWHRALLEGRPGPVDRIVTVPALLGLGGAGRDAAAEEEFYARMRAERFDVAVQMHGGGRDSNPVVARLGARVTVGFRTPDAAALDLWLPYVYLQPEVLRYLELVALLGAAPAELEPRLAVTAADVEEADAVVRGGGPLAVLHPGATDVRRRWPAERFAAVGRALAGDGAEVLVSGTEDERELTWEVARRSGGAARDVSGRLSLGGLAGLLSRARVVVSNDSGPLHLAAAVGAPTVGIFWGPHVVNSTLAARARHRPLAAFALECPRCRANALAGDCGHRDTLVGAVRTAEVLAAARDLLGLPARDPRALARALDPRGR